jgi:hypothetical protein
MRRLLLALSVAIAVLCPTAARAGNPQAITCDGFDTTVNGTPGTILGVLLSCTFTTGPYGVVYALATGQVLCGSSPTTQMSAQLYIGAGASSITGANFMGSIASNVLTAGSFVPPAPPWSIATGQILNGAGFAPVTITGQLTGSPGLAGTYSVNGSPGTIGSEPMFSLNPIPGGATILTPVMHATACGTGFTLTSIAGTFTGTPNTQYWLAVGIAGSTAWTNNAITIFTF